ncbi:hemicentin-2-like [Penaeus japonicus]|uniref:hemicentin-2-like n=1 Tax=Penaeus japonicus TaxID=27405 RepID=UPI001C710643|nr:hemicentin-2-like [Penaeus japonicus]
MSPTRSQHVFILALLSGLMMGRVESRVRGSQTDLNQLGDDEDPFTSDWDPLPTPRGPHFHPDSPRNITAAVGSPALMPCRARNLGAKSVSWIRHRDLHVLTVNSFTFTNDERFSAHRDHVTGDWVLVLRRPQPSDSGFYECSISTKPVTALSVKLEVIVPTTELLGDGHVYLDRGSTLNLTCVVHSSPTPPEFILWYHREKLVNYGRREGRLIVVNTQHSGDTTRSSLLVYNASVWDSGNYSCKPSNSKKVFIAVHVLESETPAAMQTTTSAGALGPLSHLHTLSVALGTSSALYVVPHFYSFTTFGRVSISSSFLLFFFSLAVLFASFLCSPTAAWIALATAFVTAGPLFAGDASQAVDLLFCQGDPQKRAKT